MHGCRLVGGRESEVNVACVSPLADECPTWAEGSQRRHCAVLTADNTLLRTLCGDISVPGLQAG